MSPAFGSNTIRKAIQALGVISGDLPAVRTASSDNVPALADASHCQESIWPEQRQYKASLKGAVYPKLRHSKKLWGLTSRSVPKEIALRFEATTNAPEPYKVHWQVVNTGDEALRASGLRGSFYDGEGPYGRVRWEATLYAGTHWAEAFIVKNGVSVARSGRTYVRIRG